MASRNKVARRKGKAGGGDEVSRCDHWADDKIKFEIKLDGLKLNWGSG